jgi:hypothetical protein
VKKLIGLILILGIIVTAFTMGLYSRDTGRPPWKWGQEDWHNWVTFTRAQTQVASEDLTREAKERTQTAWKWVGKNTQELYNQSKELLARLRVSPAQVTPAPATKPAQPPSALAPNQPPAAGPTVETTAPTAAVPPDPLDDRSPNYRYGKEWLRKGIDEWKVSLVQPGASERAKTFFEKAISSFQAAGQELGDPDAVKDWLHSAQKYLADTDERIAHIHQEGKTP